MGSIIQLELAGDPKQGLTTPFVWYAAHKLDAKCRGYFEKHTHY
jgi:hypothetical protein